jgi:hypothetical protein
MYIFKCPKLKPKLKIESNEFYFKLFLDIHMGEKGLTCHDYYGFKW